MHLTHVMFSKISKTNVLICYLYSLHNEKVMTDRQSSCSISKVT